MAWKVYSLFVLSFLVYGSVVFAFPECYPEACKYLTCTRYEEICKLPGAKRIKNGGFCGCCDKCVLERRKGQLCFEMSSKYTENDIICEDGTVCDVVTLKCD